MQASSHVALDDVEILKNMANRLLELASDTAQIGTSVSSLTGSTRASLSPSVIHDLQKLDNLHQSLCDLANLSAALAGPDESRAEALSMLKLGATQTLLHQQINDKPPAGGSVDIF
ncbi:MAG: hypothetical protein AAF665_18995 [Pseudomonadota bacterium]